MENRKRSHESNNDDIDKEAHKFEVELTEEERREQAV